MFCLGLERRGVDLVGHGPRLLPFAPSSEQRFGAAGIKECGPEILVPKAVGFRQRSHVRSERLELVLSARQAYAAFGVEAAHLLQQPAKIAQQAPSRAEDRAVVEARQLGSRMPG